MIFFSFFLGGFYYFLSSLALFLLLKRIKNYLWNHSICGLVASWNRGREATRDTDLHAESLNLEVLFCFFKVWGCGNRPPTSDLCVSQFHRRLTVSCGVFITHMTWYWYLFSWDLFCPVFISLYLVFLAAFSLCGNRPTLIGGVESNRC